MSTLRISNIEAKSVPASATTDEKIKITNSSGDTLVFLDGKTSGITTVGINTTDGNITFDANSNVVVTGIITASKFVGTFEPTNLTLTGDLLVPDKIVHTGDTNTAIRFPAADKITLETSGTERFQVDSSGNVYVGGVGASATAGVLWFNDTSANASKISQVNGSSALTFHTGSSQPERLRINSDGDIGVNVPSPQITKGIQISKTGGNGGVSNTYSVANQYLHLGSAEYNSSGGLFSIGFGYINSGGSTAQYAPAYLGFKETSTANHTRGDLVFATRSAYTDAEPTERLRIKHDGAIDIPSTSRITGSIVINAATPQLTNGLQVSKGGASGGAPTSVSVANEHLHLGATEYATNGLYMMGFGYVSGCLQSPAYIGFKTNSTSSCTRGDLIFATRSSTSGAAAPDERLRITSGGQVNIGGDYTQTSSTLFLKGGSASSGNVNLLELKHSDTASSTSGGGAGDGPAMLFNGFYSGNPWQFAKVCSVNSGSGYGAAFQIHVHPSDGNQAANLVKAVTIVGNGSAGSVTIHNGTLHTTYNGSSMYGAQINDSQTSGTHIQFQRQGYNNGNITHSTNSCSYNTSGSDRTLKKNFEDWTENTLDLFKSLKPQKFHFIIDNDSDPKSKGYIAQDLVDSFPEAYPKEVKSQKYMFNPSGMVVYLMKALQEEIAKREELEARITDLEGS